MRHDGPMTSEIFRAYVGQSLAPALPPGGVVVLDNLSAHKVAGVQEQSELSAQASCTCVSTARISPRLNSSLKLKTLLRKAAARTKDALWSTIGKLQDAFPEHECQKYLANCGYDFT